jgi:chromosome segregation ATPase
MIEILTQEYKNKLDFEYNQRLAKLDNEHKKRMDLISAREDSLLKQESSLKSVSDTALAAINTKQDILTSQISKAELAENSFYELVEKTKKEALDLNYSVKIQIEKYESLKDELLKERRDIEQKRIDLDNKKVELNKYRQDLDIAMQDIKSLQNKNISAASELNNREDKITIKEEEIAKMKKDIENSEAVARSNEEETKTILEQVKKLRDELQEKNIALTQAIEKTAKEGKALSAWRDELDEMKTTLTEKEKYLLLKDREVEGKIAILKKLREG